MLSTIALLAQLMAPVATRPVLAFPERGLDDSAAYQGYKTRIFRDAAGNSLQVYLDARAQRVVHLWADAEDESLGFTARATNGRAADLDWNGAGALNSRRRSARSFEYALVARNQRIIIGWFQLGSMRVERDLQYAERQKAAFSEAPFVVAEVDRLSQAIASLDASERQRHLTLLHAADLTTLRARTRPTIVTLMDSRVAVTRVFQPALDGLDTLVLEIRTDPAKVETLLAGDSLSLAARSGNGIPFRVRITTTGRALHPLRRDQMFNAPFRAFLMTAVPRSAVATDTTSLRARRLERQVRGLELLSSREKLMAGMPTYATYFGRDMLMTALMMHSVWQHQMSEFVIASALRKLSPEGQVSHEEALGGQAVRESASEYAVLIDSSRALRASGNAHSADSRLAQAGEVLKELRRVRENYHMIDAAFQFPIVVARWIGDSSISAARKRAFLLDSTENGEPRVRRLMRELALVSRLTAPYASAPVTVNLIPFAPRDSGRWASQSWRDSNVGYAGGRYAMDVNAIWAPHALESVEIIVSALRGIGLDPEAIARRAGEAAPMAALLTYIQQPASLERAVTTWSDADRHFVVRLTPSEVQARTRARLAAMNDEERKHWSGVLDRTRADRDSLSFLALSLDTDGRPIPVANSDPSTRLFLGDIGAASAIVTARTRDEVRRDVSLFARPYPVGLLIDSVGPVVANDAYAGPSTWRDFERDRYHGPRVVWGRENNLFLLGTMHRIDEASTSAARHDPANAAYVRELRAAVDKVLAAVQASGFHSELWSYEVRGDRVTPVRYGSGSDVQLWSTTDLVVQYERYRIGR
ncbi:hypothetical protein BH09GEM1_BH09GEM1_20560 [soil metagenome]